MLPKYLVPLAGTLAATSVSAANLLPLKVGSYIGPGERCADANVFYPGGSASIGSPVSDCDITSSVSHKGAIYSFSESCTDKQSGGTVTGKQKMIVISPTSFKWIAPSADVIKYCGPLPKG